MSLNQSIAPMLFAISNDGGKSGIRWSHDPGSLLDWLEPHRKAMCDYSVVAVRNPLQDEELGAMQYLLVNTRAGGVECKWLVVPYSPEPQIGLYQNKLVWKSHGGWMPYDNVSPEDPDLYCYCQIVHPELSCVNLSQRTRSFASCSESRKLLPDADEALTMTVSIPQGKEDGYFTWSVYRAGHQDWTEDLQQELLGLVKLHRKELVDTRARLFRRYMYEELRRLHASTNDLINKAVDMSRRIQV